MFSLNDDGVRKEDHLFESGDQHAPFGSNSSQTMNVPAPNISYPSYSGEILEKKISRLNHGDHTCSFYEDATEQETVLSSFIRSGLSKGERCICVLGDQTFEELATKLQKAEVDVPYECERGALIFISGSQWRNSGQFEIPAMADGVKKLLNQASSSTWQGLWVAVEMTWSMDPEIDPNLLGEWESFWNKLIEGMPTVLLCQYNRKRIPSAAIYLALKTHPFIVTPNDVNANFYYEPPDLLQDSQAHAERAEWMLQQFERARALEQERARRLHEQAVRIEAEEGQKRVTNILESITDGFMALDSNGHFTYINRNAMALFERLNSVPKVTLGENFWEKFPDALGSLFKEQCHKSMSDLVPVDFETFDPRLKAWFEVHLYPSTQGLSIYFREITSRKQMEESLRQSLKEKEVLLQEIHHRVKNNLQVVASLLGLQARGIKDPELRILFKESQDRVRSMALIHEKLCSSETLAEIDLSTYIRDLVSELLDSYGLAKEKISLTVEVQGVTLPLNPAITCALILHELVSNSLKYAFPGDIHGKIKVALNCESDGNARLVVSDDGVGISDEMDVHKAGSLGLRIVSLLTQQLGGTLAVVHQQGTVFTLTFPFIKKPGSSPGYSAPTV